MSHFLRNKYFFLIAGLIIGTIVGLLLQSLYSRNANISTHTLEFAPKSDIYKFTSPLLDCDVLADGPPTFLVPFEYKLDDLQNKIINQDKLASHVSIYFRDLTLGASFGVDANEEFSPASLLKVPLMMAYLKLSEKDPQLLSKELMFEKSYGDETKRQNINPSQKIVMGKKYTVEDLIQYMIEYSDNNAQRVLYENIATQDLNRVYTDLGITIPGVKKLEDYMTVREYASFFRMLYNSTYLERDMSEKALGYLSRVDYDRGISAGIPKDILVAHKFGEREITIPTQERVKQLHDCGIVYYSKRPYLLCIMSRGDSFDNLAKASMQISKLVFDQVNKL